ncbi:MAG: radical SAM protein [Deltaproteobacteria bacterium]|nr:radical SAM protein [Deltaproteobacteria bacterium]
MPERNGPDLDLRQIEETCRSFSGSWIRLSGGEPTLRDDLPEIVALCARYGKRAVLLTNGLRLADRRYLRILKEAVLRGVHFAFNGFRDRE